MSQYSFVLILLLISFLPCILNIPSPININSFSPFYISINEIVFQYEYNSDEKTDIICFFNPYLNETVYGEMKLYINNITEESFFNETFFCSLKNYIIINSNNNKGKGIYYIYLKGNLYCSFEIFSLNEIKYIDINNTYLFQYLFGYEH